MYIFVATYFNLPAEVLFDFRGVSAYLSKIPFFEGDCSKNISHFNTRGLNRVHLCHNFWISYVVIGPYGMEIKSGWCDIDVFKVENYDVK